MSKTNYLGLEDPFRKHSRVSLASWYEMLNFFLWRFQLFKKENTESRAQCTVNPALRTLYYLTYQRWSPRGRPWPRGHILKSLALASKPQVLENCPVLGSRTAQF